MNSVHSLDSSTVVPDMGHDRAKSVANRLVAPLLVALREFLRFAQFAIFIVYLFVSVIGFWVWILAFLIGALRLLLKLTRHLLLLISALHPPPTGWTRGGSLAERLRAEVQRLWNQRLLLYADLARPVGRQLVAWSHSARRFWHLPLFHKLVAAVVSLGFVFLPLAFLVPRPHEVQITDRNSFSHADGSLRYLIHAVDLRDPSRTREYENEYAFYLGKINPQGLKAALHEGHFYRLWVVGIRWNYLPKTTYPNIVSVVEINKDGSAVETAHLGPVPSVEEPSGR
ncbi:MAG: hypothetical protein RLZZ53_1214 [Acidobacteriota bacterium]